MSEKCCEIQPRSKDVCPACGRRGKKVDTITLEHLLKPEKRSNFNGAEYYFCESPECNTVYFSGDGDMPFFKSDLTVRVGIKETEEPLQVCYCFGYTEAMIAEEIIGTGRTSIPEQIREEVRKENCSCEITNPRGSCCLGDVGRAVKRQMAIHGNKHQSQETEHVDDCCAIDSPEKQ